MITELFNYIQYKFKKKFGNMNNHNEAMVQRYKQQYFGKMYKWSRPINGEEVGDIVRVVDVKQKGDMIMLIFNSGSPLNLSLIDSYLQPMPDEQPEPSAYANGMQDNNPIIPIPEELKEYTSPKISFAGADVPKQQMQQAAAIPVKKKSDMFALFQSEEKEINLPLKIKIPDITLVKMMFNNAADKDTFLTELAEYVISGINVETVKSAMSNILCDNVLQEEKQTVKQSVEEPIDIEKQDENTQQQDEHK